MCYTLLVTPPPILETCGIHKAPRPCVRCLKANLGFALRKLETANWEVEHYTAEVAAARLALEEAAE